MPARSGFVGPREEFRTKCELIVELFREQAEILKGRHLAVFDGGFALRSVVRPLVAPEDDSTRIEFLTRLRHDARLYAPLPERHRANQKWGRRLPPPRQGGYWEKHWREAKAFLYGRWRKVRWKEVVCRWHVSGHDVPVKAVVAKVEGYKKRFTLVTSAVELTGLQVVELFCAVPPGGRVSGSEAAAGLGGVPGVDPQPDRADQPGAVGDDEFAATGAVPPGGGRRGGLVVPPAVEQEEGPAERAGRGAAVQASSGEDRATSVGGRGK